MAKSSASLSQQGCSFAKRLAAFLAQRHSDGSELVQPFTSTLPRAIETAQEALPSMKARCQAWSSLGILNTGVCHGLTVKEISERLPEAFAKWKANPFRHRFPGGESILDMNKRLIDVVMEIER